MKKKNWRKMEIYRKKLINMNEERKYGIWKKDKINKKEKTG